MNLDRSRASVHQCVGGWQQQLDAIQLIRGLRGLRSCPLDPRPSLGVVPAMWPSPVGDAATMDLHHSVVSSHGSKQFASESGHDEDGTGFPNETSHGVTIRNGLENIRKQYPEKWIPTKG